MRKCTVISLLIILLAVGGAVLVKRCPRTVPLEETSELYRRYADTEGIVASFVQGYRLNDSVCVDVTLLQATDSAAWEQLLADFTIPKISSEYLERIISKPSVTARLRPKNHPEQPMDTTLLNNDVYLYSLNMKSIAICHITEEKQFDVVMARPIHEVKHNTLNN